MENTKKQVNPEVAQETQEAIKEVKTDTQKQKIRNLIKALYDLQKLRIANGNRVVQSFNIQMGQKPSKKQEDMDDKARKLIQQMKKEYDRITDAYVNKSYVLKKKIDNDTKVITIKINKNASIEKIINTLKDDKKAEIEFIRSKIDYELIGTYVDLMDAEERILKILTIEVAKHPMWDKFFKDIKGCGILMSAVCISYFDIHEARHVSSFWKYAGLDVVAIEDGEDKDGVPKYRYEGRSRNKSHQEEREYISSNGEVKTKVGLTYNPELKTKLCGVLGPSFLKTGKGEKYEQIYREYRARLAQRPDLKAEYNEKGEECDSNKLHRHAMANRYMVKAFVRDLWVTWRAYEGYEVTEPYEVAKLGMKPHKYNEYHERVAQATRR